METETNNSSCATSGGRRILHVTEDRRICKDVAAPRAASTAAAAAAAATTDNRPCGRLKCRRSSQTLEHWRQTCPTTHRQRLQILGVTTDPPPDMVTTDPLQVMAYAL